MYRRVRAGKVPEEDSANKDSGGRGGAGLVSTHRDDVLVRVLTEALDESSPGGLLQRVVTAAREGLRARLGIIANGFERGVFAVAATSSGCDAPSLRRAEQMASHGGLIDEVVARGGSIRLTHAELVAHPRFRGLPAGHVPLRGLVAAPLTTTAGTAVGLLMVSDRDEGEFEERDEILLTELGLIASLALRHLGARTDAERHAADLQQLAARKDALLGALSHELRNPLSPIRTAVHLLSRETLPSPRASRALATIDRQSAHLTRLLDDLLDVTRLGHEDVRLQCECIDLGGILRGTVEDYRATVEARGLALTSSIAPLPVWVEGDAARLRQLLGNLVDNAVKFTPAGGEITLSLRRSGESAIIVVEDNGQGIEPSLLPSLFEPFVQGDQTLARTNGGLGLGLTLARTIATLHEGSIAAHSDGEGRGARLEVELPLATPLGQAPMPKAGAPSTSRRVLIIEDNVDAAESLRDAIELLGHSAEVADTGVCGLEMARSFVPDVILCDIGLPEMDGYAVAQSVRSDATLAGVYLVALTGYALPEDKQRALESGFDRHLSKPASIEDIEQTLAGQRAG